MLLEPQRLQVRVVDVHHLKCLGVPIAGRFRPFVSCELRNKPASRFETSWCLSDKIGDDIGFDEAGIIKNYCEGDCLDIVLIGGHALNAKTTELAVGTLEAAQLRALAASEAARREARRDARREARGEASGAGSQGNGTDAGDAGEAPANTTRPATGEVGAEGEEVEVLVRIDLLDSVEVEELDCDCSALAAQDGQGRQAQQQQQQQQQQEQPPQPRPQSSAPSSEVSSWGSAEVTLRLLILPPERVPGGKTSKGVACCKFNVLCGSIEAVGPAEVYVARPRDVLEELVLPPVNCVLIAHDESGLCDGRCRQLADAFAVQGWLAIVPDYSSKSSTSKDWFQAIDSYTVDFLLPWLEGLQVESVGILGLGSGALIAAHCASGGRRHLEGGATFPKIVATALAYPRFKKPHILNDADLQKLVAIMAAPLLVMPCKSSQRQSQYQGLLHFVCDLRERPVEFVDFGDVAEGFLTDGNLEVEEVRDAVGWAVEASSAFFHRNFAVAPALGEADKAACSVDPELLAVGF